MADFWIWWILAALLVGLELATGTFYLLALGLAFLLGGLAAWLGASLTMQMIIGGALSAIALAVAHHWRKRAATSAPMMHLDRGQAVHVEKWNADGTARVEYRGTQWNAEAAAADTVRSATMYIVATRGSTLVLSDRRP
ncbi:MAG TPA: NfeD family protein [Casimicrobiaceae bacterium]|jgi:membrane protein implicated in regulation of membrane protease activity